MKVICLGGLLSGIDEVVGKAADLEDVVPDRSEPLVLICHGRPTERVTDRETGEQISRTPPELLEFNLRAVVIAHRDHAPAAEHVEEVRRGVAAKCHRVFGLTRGWETLDRELLTRLIDFLASGSARPADAEVERLLVGDAQMVRLALRVALEIAREELSLPGGRCPHGRPSDRDLIEPALVMARRDYAAADVAQGLAEALNRNNTEALRQEVERALGAVRGLD